MRRSGLLLLAVLLASLGAMAAKSLLIEIPRARAQSPEGEFDATRAKARLTQVLGDQRPHPADSPADDAVRNRIVGLLRAMGLKPIVRDQLACNELYKQRGIACARVRNVVAVIGPPTGKALLLNAHYDSVPVGPGASDDGAGVATLLEVAEILRDRPLKRPVVLLFNEGEELGLVGARAFLADPLSRDVDSLINLEARGVRGPVNMFETSRPNGAPVALFARAVKHPVANSLSTDVYRLMPNYTDVNSFAERHWLTLNLAPIGNETRYHSAGDEIAALDPATLQHMGDQTLALAQGIANAPRRVDDGDRIFMDVSGRWLISLPMLAGGVLLVALLIAFAAVARSRRAVLQGLSVVIGTLVGSAVLSWLALMLIGAVRHGMFWRAHPIWTNLAAYASVLLVAAVLLATLGRRLEVRQLRASFWLTYLIGGALIGLVAPGGIIFFLFPPLIALIGVATWHWWRPAEVVGSFAAILLLYLTWGALLALLEELLNSGPMWLFGPLGALLLLPAAIEAKPLIDAARLRGAAIAAGALFVLAWAASAAAPAYSADRQQRFVIEHVTDADRGTTTWSVLNGGVPVPPAYRGDAQWRWGKLPYADSKRWLAGAPADPAVKAPSAELVATLRNGNERRITVRLHSNGADRITLVGPEDARIGAAGTGGFVRPIDAAAEDGRYLLSCSGRSCDGITLDIVSTAPKPIEFLIVGARFGLPSTAAPLIAGRPKFARPQYVPDETVVFRRVKL